MILVKKIVVVVLIVSIVSCKKKKDESEKQPDPTPVVPAQGHSNRMSAKINGVNWAVTANQTATADISVDIINTTPKTYVVTGRTQALNRHAIYVGFTYTTGTVQLENFTNFYAAYDDSSGTGHFVKSGTLTIETIDTSHIKSAVCDKLKATFSFVTIPMGNPGYTITEGVIDFEAK